MFRLHSSPQRLHHPKHLGGAEAHEDVDAAGDVFEASNTVTISLAAKQKQEAPEESDINNTPTATLHEVRVEGLLCPHLLLSPMGKTVVMELGLGRTAALRPPLSRE